MEKCLRGPSAPPPSPGFRFLSEQTRRTSRPLRTILFACLRCTSRGDDMNALSLLFWALPMLGSQRYLYFAEPIQLLPTSHPPPPKLKGGDLWAGEHDGSNERSSNGRINEREAGAAAIPGGTPRGGRRRPGDGSIGAKGGGVGGGVGSRRDQAKLSPRGRAGAATVIPPSPSSALSKPDSFDYLTAEVSEAWCTAACTWVATHCENPK